MSFQGYSVDEIADILNVHRNTVSKWIKLFEQNGLDGLKTKIGQGRSSILDKSEQKLALEISKRHPTNTKAAVDEIEQKIGKRISTWTLKRLLKKAKMKWKRVRKSLKSKQDPEKVKQAKKDIAELKKLEKDDEINLVYMDESGFDLTPSVPYAWQESGRDKTIKLPSSRSTRINVLGFMDEKNDLTPFVVEKPVDSCFSIACFDHFSKALSATTVVVIDNAPIHTSRNFINQIEIWQKRGLYLFIHLNLIKLKFYGVK